MINLLARTYVPSRPAVYKTSVYWWLIIGDYINRYIQDHHNPLWESLSTNQHQGMREGFEHCSADVSGVCFFLIVGVAARQLLLLSACLWFSRAYHQEGFLRRLPLSLAESLVHVVASVRASAVGVKVFLFLLFLLFFIFFFVSTSTLLSTRVYPVYPWGFRKGGAQSMRLPGSGCGPPSAATSRKPLWKPWP